MDCSLPGSPGHGIFQARTLEWVAIASCRESSPPRDRTRLSCVFTLAGGFFTAEPAGRPCLHEAFSYFFFFQVRIIFFLVPLYICCIFGTFICVCIHRYIYVHTFIHLYTFIHLFFIFVYLSSCHCLIFSVLTINVSFPLT